MPLAGFEPAIPAGNRLQTYVLDGNRVSTVDNRHLGLRYEIRLWPIYLFIYIVFCYMQPRTAHLEQGMRNN